MRVSLFIPLVVIGVFAVTQLFLGTSPAIVAMGAGAVAVPFLPLALYECDLYALLGISFSLKYAGFALAAKTFYGQTLDSNLYDPYAAFGLTLLLMFVLTSMISIARALDRGKAFFQFPMDLVSLRRLSLLCIFIGIAGNLAYSTGVSATGTVSLGGPAVVLGAVFRQYYYFGLIAETLYAVIKTGGRSFVTRRLVFLFLIQTVISIVFNERGGLVSSLIGIIVVAFLYKMLRIHHLIMGIVATCFFIFVFSPITIYLRFHMTGLSLTEFAEFAEDTIVKAATEPEFFKMVSETQKNSAFENMNAVVPYDYYGVRSEVLERLSFVSLVDAVYNGTRTRAQIGMAGIAQSVARAAPGFLGFDKEITTIGPGDWLSWRTGLEEPGVVSFAVFGLPMEGLAVWGLSGMILYPFVFILPLLYVCGRLSSLRLSLPVSIYLFVVTQHFILDGTSDDFMTWMTRSLPVNFLILFVLHAMLRTRAVLPRPHTI